MASCSEKSKTGNQSAGIDGENAINQYAAGLTSSIRCCVLRDKRIFIDRLVSFL